MIGEIACRTRRRGRRANLDLLPTPTTDGNSRLDRNDPSDHCLLSTDPAFMGGKVRMGNKCLDVEHLADRKRVPSTLLHCS